MNRIHPEVRDALNFLALVLFVGGVAAALCTCVILSGTGQLGSP
jgi:hypothetical protein